MNDKPSRTTFDHTSQLDKQADDPRKERTLLSGEVIRVYGDDHDGCTTWESNNGVDVLGPDWEPYNRHCERFVLDHDDTFKDTGKYWIIAHREVLKSFNFSDEETTDDAILALFGHIDVGNRLGIERFVKDGVQHTDDQVWGMIKARAEELLASHPMDPLLLEALKKAKAMGVNMAVWSSSPREVLASTISTNGLEGLFDAVISVDDVDEDKRKPHPQGLLKAVRAMDEAQGYLEEGEDYSDEKPLKMNGVWMMGDSPNDVLGGKTVGASTVWLEHPLQGHNAHEKREKTVQNVRESLGAIAAKQVTEVMDDLRPTLVIRTFDPEEAGYSRNVSIMDMPVEVVRDLTTVNINFVKFLTNRRLRAEAYRWEQVQKALREQGVDIHTNTEDIAAAMYGETTTGVKPIAPRPVSLAKTPEEATRSLKNIDAKQQPDILL